jgi:endonuclease G
VVTNRHVASIFGTRKGEGFTFRPGLDRRKPVRARIDYREEYGTIVPQMEFRITEILHIEEDVYDAPDIAFLRVAPLSEDNEKLPTPITLSDRPAKQGDNVAVIGYPAKDSRIPEPEVMERIFQGVYDVKRLSPGQVMSADQQTLTLHDCTTLGGNSGSVVLDMNSGAAVGLHFAGVYKTANYAVPAAVVKQRLDALKVKNG